MRALDYGSSSNINASSYYLGSALEQTINKKIRNR